MTKEKVVVVSVKDGKVFSKLTEGDPDSRQVRKGALSYYLSRGFVIKQAIQLDPTTHLVNLMEE